ncbi:carbohydrate binding domain-containing protein [Microbacterium sp. ISL-59]|uniref:carbohydrate binding domain-containing protein n=1 Tax=Microbacterium sp. ISL-59 TaxID=2819159 RepID=UPI0027DEE401|nr:carbohydrate binding domain-containing protein [Microbacterium sp. ISL-59]
MKSRPRSTDRHRSRSVSRPAALLGVAALIASSVTAVGLPVAAFAAPTDIIENGTFESGVSGWTAPLGGTLSTSTDARTGAKALAIGDRSSFQSGPTATVTGLLKTDQSYDLSLSLKFDAGRATQNFNVVLCTSTRSRCDVVASTTATAGEWSTVEKTFTPLSADYDIMFVETPWSTDVQSFVIDDVSLTTDDGAPAVTEPPAVPGNLLPDGRFVSDLTGWTNTRGGTLSLSDDAASGAHSLKVTGRENTQSGPFASVADKIELGASYRLTGTLKYDEGNATQQFNFTFCPTNFNGCADYGHTFTKGEWGTFSQEFTAEAKHVAAGWLFVETPWGSEALQDFSVDELSLVKIADAPEVPAFTSLEKVQTKPIGDHNPLVGHKFGADPHHLVYNGRLYIYSTDDTQQYDLNSKDENGLPTQSNGYGGITRLNVMSTTDMVNWVDHGAVPIAREGGAAPWARNSWAPAAIEKDGKVYLYFCDSGTGTAVVVGGSPLGPWEDPLGKKIIPDTVSRDYIAEGGFPAGMWLFDPEVFIDDDGQGYLYFGGNSQIGTSPNVQGPQNPKSTRVVKLQDDMVTLDGDPVEIDAPGMFEASSMFKRDGKYYYSYSSNFQVNEAPGLYPSRGAIAYMMTDDPMKLGSSEYAGVAFQNQGTFFGAGNGGNNHSDTFTYKGETYFTYHAQTRGAAWAAALGTPGSTQGYRSVHIDKLEFNADGTIKPVVGTKAGVEQVESFDPYRTFEAETLAWQLGITTTKTDAASVEFPEHNGSGNMVLSGVDDGDFSGISGVDFGSGAQKVSAKVKPLVAGSSIQVRLDDVDGPVVAEIPVDGTVGEWTTVEAEVTGATGEHDVFFVFAGAEGTDAETDLFEVDNWAFTAIDDSPGAELSAQLSVSTVAAGGKVTVTATGVTADEVEIGIESTYRALATATTADGRIEATVTVPADTTAGAHHIVLRDGETELARLPLTVTRESTGGGTDGGTDGGPSTGGGTGGTDGSLANTGGDASASLTAAWIGALLLALGSAFWMLRRRGRSVMETETE